MGLLSSSYLAFSLIFIVLHTNLILSVPPNRLNPFYSYRQDKKVALALAKISQQVEKADCHIHVINLSKSQDLPGPSIPITIDSKLIKTPTSFRSSFMNTSDFQGKLKGSFWTCPNHIRLNVLQNRRVSCVFAIIVNPNENVEDGTEVTLKRVQDTFNVVDKCLLYLPLSKGMEKVYGDTTYEWNVGPRAPVFVYLTSNSSNFEGEIKVDGDRDLVWKLVDKGLQYFDLWFLNEHEVKYGNEDAFESSETVKRLCYKQTIKTWNLCMVNMNSELGTTKLERNVRNKVSILDGLRQSWLYNVNDQEVPSKYLNMESNLQLNPLKLPRENPNFNIFLISHLINQERNATLILCQSKGKRFTEDCTRSTSSSEVSIKARINIQRLLQVDWKIEAVLEKFQTFRFLTCYTEKRLSFQFYVDPFEPQVWGGLGLSLLTLSALFHLYVRQKMPELLKKNFSPFLSTLSTLCDDSYPAPEELQKMPLYRFVFGMWFLVCILFVNSYHSLAIKGMLHPLRGTSVERFEELLPSLDRNPNATAIRVRFDEKASFRWNLDDGNGEFQIFSTPTTKATNRWGKTYQRTAFGDMLKDVVLWTILARKAEVDKFTEEEVLASSFYWPRFIYSRHLSNGSIGSGDSNSTSKKPGSTLPGQIGGNSGWKPGSRSAGQSGGNSTWKPGSTTGGNSGWKPSFNTTGKTGGNSAWKPSSITDQKPVFNNASQTGFDSLKPQGSNSLNPLVSKSPAKEGFNNQPNPDSNAAGNTGLKLDKLSAPIKNSAEKPNIIKSLSDPPPYWEDSSIEQEMVHCGRKAYVNADDRVEAEFQYLSTAYPWIKFTLGKEKILPDVKVWSFSNYGGSKVNEYFKRWIQSGLFKKVKQYFQKAQYRLRLDFTRDFTSTKFGLTQGSPNPEEGDPLPLRLSDSVQTIFILYGGLMMTWICVYFIERFSVKP